MIWLGRGGVSDWGGAREMSDGKERGKITVKMSETMIMNHHYLRKSVIHVSLHINTLFNL